MTFILQIVLAVAALVLLYYGAEFLVRGGVAVARKLHVSSLVIGLTLVAFATSAPELVVSSNAAWSGLGDISLGNIIGSNICNIALILGLSAAITPLAVNRKLFRMDLPLMVLSTLAFAGILCCCHGVGRLAAGCFLAVLILWTILNIRSSRKEGLEKGSEAEEAVNAPPIALGKAVLFVLLGLGMLVLGGKWLVDAAVYFARLLHVSDAVISLTIVAIGTSLPELATSIVAALHKETDIAIGNVVGSNIFNVLGILGVAPLIAPLHMQQLNAVDFGAMLFVTLLLVPLLCTGRVLKRWEGFLLLAFYVSYITYLVMHA